MKINIDKSGANGTAILAYNQQSGVAIEIRQCKYINNIAEQDHRHLKQEARAALGFKAFDATLQGLELIQMIRKRQVRPIPGGDFIEQFNYLAM